MRNTLNTSLLLRRNTSYLLGALASGLCLIHCLVTPIIFIAQACTLTCCESSPHWWRSLDYFFLFISFIAVIRSSKITSKARIGVALWFSWSMLLFTITNETFKWYDVPSSTLYIPGLSLIALHLYNQRYCECGNNCTINHKESVT